jgi:hypothetical protein
MKFKPIIGTDLSGHIGGVVASHNTYGPYFRQRVRPVNRKTLAQQSQRTAIAICSATWRALGPTVQAAWNAATVVKTSRKGDKVNLSGQAAWMFVNTIRYRVGLAPVVTPPTTTLVPLITTPSLTFTAHDTVNMYVQLSDPWAGPAGWLAIAGSLITSPGVSYRAPNRSVLVQPGSSYTSPIPYVVTLPFSVPVNGRVRLNLHAGIPDGRQTTYIDVEATNTGYPPPPPAAASVLEVTKVGTKTFLWQFDQPITVTPGADANLTINADASGTVVNQAGPNAATVTYTTANAPGLPWSVVLQPTSITQPVRLPQSGTTD